MHRIRNNNYALQCWICDYGFLILALIVIIGFGIFFRLSSKIFYPNQEAGLIKQSITPTKIATIAPTQTDQNENEVYQSPTATSTFENTPITQSSATAVPQKPIFIIAFIPVNWKGNLNKFERAANAQFNFFVRESKIDQFFDVRQVNISENFISPSWGEASLLIDLIEFGLLKVAADRYMGLTNRNLSIDGNSQIEGWTLGEDYIGAIGESKYLDITAHELGHTFGLCDEYSYKAWSQQNSTYLNGCPNSFPPECIPENDSCSPWPNSDGYYSIMGFAIENAHHIYYQDSLEGLQYKFEQMLRRQD